MTVSEMGQWPMCVCVYLCGDGICVYSFLTHTNTLHASIFSNLEERIPCWLLLTALLHIVQGYLAGPEFISMPPASNSNR